MTKTATSSGRKCFLLLALVLAAVVVLLAVSAPIFSTPIALRVQVVPRDGEAFDAESPTDKHCMRCGGEFQLRLTPSRDAYALVYLVATKGLPRELSPGLDADGSMLFGGKESVLPAPDGYFTLDEKPGRGAIIVAWWAQPLKTRESLFFRAHRLLESGAATPEERIEKVRKLLAAEAHGAITIPFQQIKR